MPDPQHKQAVRNRVATKGRGPDVPDPYKAANKTERQ